MNLKEKIIAYSLAAGMALFPSFGCNVTFGFGLKKGGSFSQNSAIPPSNPVDKYAVLVCGSSDCNTKYNENVDPIDVDCESLALFRIYNHLSKAGFKDKNIRILYSRKDRDPNFDAGDQNIAKKVQEKHFSGQYNNDASESNIESILDKLKEKADSNDKVVFYLLAHGDFFGNIYLEDKEFFGEMILPREFQKYLEGWKSNSNWFMTMNCYGGATVDQVDVDNVFLFSGTQSDKANWVDKDWDAGEKFIKHKLDKKNDTNKDGIVDYQEATDAVIKEATTYWTTFLREFLKNEYKGGTPNPDWVSIIPKTKVGKKFKKANLK